MTSEEKIIEQAKNLRDSLGVEGVAVTCIDALQDTFRSKVGEFKEISEATELHYKELNDTIHRLSELSKRIISIVMEVDHIED